LRLRPIGLALRGPRLQLQKVLRNRLIIAFLAATVVPLAATLWIATALLDRSLAYATTKELDALSKSLEQTAREFYQQARQDLKDDALAGRRSPIRYAIAAQSGWPAPVGEFWDSAEPERFVLSGEGNNHIDYLVRRDDGVSVYSRDLGPVRMQELTDQYRAARETVAGAQNRDVRRGLTITLIVLVVAVWLLALTSLIYLAHRISRPIQDLTGGLSELASGNLQVRLASQGNDETGQAISAFNHMAGQLQESRERLVYLTQIASWQTLARKMAHELKNSLTPIRLTVEEIAARQPAPDRQFMDRAVQIVVEEIESLERRVRAFSEFSSEPEPWPSALDVNGLIEERIAFLKPGHSGVTYALRLSERCPLAFADADHIKGILTNLLENAAEAAGDSGRVLSVTSSVDGKVIIEIHDSGPGLSEEASRSLFEPTITFKKGGMGLGLSITRKSALLNGGDVQLVPGELGGAAFRVVLPEAE
jgi:two-component system, NtrC family, nitrogen regulation sensor histidine kinase NtrY